MKILLAAAECSPLARTGGLGEAVAGLAGALGRAGHSVTVALPLYRHLKYLSEPQADGIARYQAEGFSVLLIEDKEAFDRIGIYGDAPGKGYPDQWRRFGRFSAAVRRLANGYDVAHLHDAHVGPAAIDNPVATVFTIHNAAYGIFGPLQESAIASQTDLRHTGPEQLLEWWGEASFLKAGIASANRVTTVSPTFAQQLSSDGEISGGLDEVIRSRQIIGIVNGIDSVSWDPGTDSMLAKPFHSRLIHPRSATRRQLLETAGLSNGVLFGNVGRMAEQKGLHLLDEHLDELVEEQFRLVLVGNGELDGMVDRWVAKHPQAVWHAEYDESLARLISGGSDYYLMPSRFEPCGIGQLYAMRYGSPPLVRLTGGLADTVVDIDEEPTVATGLGFRDFRAAELAKTVRRAMRIFKRSRREYRQMQLTGMNQDFSWDATVAQYEQVYAEAMGTKSVPNT